MRYFTRRTLRCLRLVLELSGRQSITTPIHCLGIVVRQTSYDVIIGRCVKSDMNLARTSLMQHETLSDGQGLSAPVTSVA